MAGCRDCSRCTERGIRGLVMLPWRIVWSLTGGLIMGMFRKNCPQCRHRLAWHHRDATGRFAD